LEESSLAAALNKWKIPSASGGKRHGATVIRLSERLATGRRRTRGQHDAGQRKLSVVERDEGKTGATHLRSYRPDARRGGARYGIGSLALRYRSSMAPECNGVSLIATGDLPFTAL